MNDKYKIGVLGIGAVGGYFGGKLAAHYAGSDSVSVALIARGENARAIKSNGLKLISPDGEEIIHPSLVTNRAEELGELNLILCCVKGYDLESSLAGLKSCITDKTMILPLINGVNWKEQIEALYPQAEVWHGCVYIISRLVEPGVVKVSGTNNMFHYGLVDKTTESMTYATGVFKTAGINANLSHHIEQRLWEKYLLISPLATLTSYLDVPSGKISGNSECYELLFKLFTELKAVADAKKITLTENIVQKLMERVSMLPADATTSMHTDFQNGRRTELSSLTTYVVDLGKQLHVPTPTYDRMLIGLQEIIARNKKL